MSNDNDNLPQKLKAKNAFIAIDLSDEEAEKMAEQCEQLARDMATFENPSLDEIAEVFGVNQ